MRMHRNGFRNFILIVLTLLLPSAAVAQGGFRVVIQPAATPQKYAVYQRWMENTRMLHSLAESVNRDFTLSAPATIAAGECGVINAFWDPGNRMLVMCYEMMDAIHREFRYDGLSQRDFENAVTSATMFVAMHEVGHALVDILDLPVTGREEDVVDQFATIVLAQTNPEPALWAAEYWRTKDDFGDTGLFKHDRTPFDNEHSFDMQRFYNVLCWTYGTDPRNRAQILRALPQGRAERCPGEYQRMASSWGRILTPHLRARRPVLRPLPTARVASLAGGWTMTEQIGARGSDFYCESQIQLAIQQSGQGFVAPFRQTGQCVVNGMQQDNPAQGQIQNGRIDGSQVTFQMETCNYAGSMRGDVPGIIVGNLACAVQQPDGSTRTVNGVWQATRR